MTDLLSLLRRRWAIALTVVLLCGAAAVGYALTAPTEYAATTTVYVSTGTEESEAGAYEEGLAAQQRVTTYSYIAGGTNVADRVIDELELDTSAAELRSRISVTFPPATALLEITATDTDPEGARQLADAFATQFQEVVSELEATGEDSEPIAVTTVLDPAELPTSPIGPSTTKLAALGLVAGLGLGVAAAFVRERFDRRVRTPEQLGEVLPAPVVVVSGREPEATRAFARLRRVLAGRSELSIPATLTVTSVSGRAQPVVAIRLARSLAAAGAKTVLVDTDTSGEGPSQALDLRKGPGLANWLASRKTRLETVLRQTEGGVAFVPLGAVSTRTLELLDSERFAAFLAELGQRYDRILLATVSDPVEAATLAAAWKCAGAVAVAELGTRIPRTAGRAFADAGVPVVATVALAAVRRSDVRANRRTAKATGQEP